MKYLLIYTLVFLNPDTGAETRTHHSEPMPTLEMCGQVMAQLIVIERPEGHFVFQDMECNLNE